MSGIRIHVARRDPLTRPGGMHRVITNLALGQEALGLRPIAVDNIRFPRKYTANVMDSGSPRPAEAAVLQEPGGIATFHFAETALPFIYGRSPLTAGRARVLDFHGPWAAEGRVQGNGPLRVHLKALLERVAYRRFDHIVVHSEAFADIFASTFAKHHQTVHVIHPGVDVGRFRPAPSRASARHQLGWPLNDPIVVSVRRLEPRMGLESAIDAIVKLPGAHLMIVGTGSLSSVLQARAVRAGVSDRVHLTGQLPEALLPLAYRAADVAVVPTWQLEGFGMVVLEAMACGTPVVATNVGGLGEAMGPFASDWTVPPADVLSLVEKLGAALQSPNLEGAVLEYARSRSLRVMAQRYEDLEGLAI